MTVEDLITYLQTQPADRIVVTDGYEADLDCIGIGTPREIVMNYNTIPRGSNSEKRTVCGHGAHVEAEIATDPDHAEPVMAVYLPRITVFP